MFGAIKVGAIAGQLTEAEATGLLHLHSAQISGSEEVYRKKEGKRTEKNGGRGMASEGLGFRFLFLSGF